MVLDVTARVAGRQEPPRRRVAATVRRIGPGAGVVVVGAVAAYLAHELVDAVGVLTWAVLFGALATNLGLLPDVCQPGIKVATRRVLRTGVVLLGLSLSAGAVLDLGLPVIALVVTTLTVTLVSTLLIGQRLGLGRPRSLLIGTGFAICGASAIAAMEENAEADEEDVATAIAMVTLCGTIAMVALPLLRHPLGLTTEQFGIWAGASVHEVGQVVAAASPAGATAVGIAVVVKLTRVLMLAPVVATVSVLRRRTARVGGQGSPSTLPPLVPAFVMGFVACVMVRSLGLLPEAWLPTIATVQTLTLAAALFGMGTAVQVRSLLKSAGPALGLSLLSTVLVAAVSLAGVVALG
jgi:uncharacterized integral membrane protein (TIGR00698 family)